MTDPAVPPLSDRRAELRRAEDCVLLLEAAAQLGGTEVTALVHTAVRNRLPSIEPGMPLAAALAIARAAVGSEPDGADRDLERRVLHRRPAFNHALLLGDLFPWRP